MCYVGNYVMERNHQPTRGWDVSRAICLWLLSTEVVSGFQDCPFVIVYWNSAPRSVGTSGHGYQRKEPLQVGSDLQPT